MSYLEELSKRLQEPLVTQKLVALYGAQALPAHRDRFLRLAAALPPENGTEGRLYSASGRTELGGNHTDHNRGKVLCAAVRLDAIAWVLPRNDRRVEIVSEGFDGKIIVDLADLAPKTDERGKTEALVRGVGKSLADRGCPLRGFEAGISSRVLPGSGLSSSAAIELLLGTILADLAEAAIPPPELARIGQEAENRFFGKPCGLMDQMASAVGSVVAIDFEDPAAPGIDKIDFDFEAQGYTLAVVNTGGSHADLTPDYASIPAEMRAAAALLGGRELRDVKREALLSRGPEIRAALGDRAFLRALHFLGENDRVDAMVEALGRGDLNAFFEQVRASGDSSWRLLQNLYPASSPREQGLCAALAISEDFLGDEGAARVHGGGFAGTIQAYVPNDRLPAYTALMERYFGPGIVMPLAIRHEGATRIL